MTCTTEDTLHNTPPEEEEHEDDALDEDDDDDVDEGGAVGSRLENVIHEVIFVSSILYSGLPAGIDFRVSLI